MVWSSGAFGWAVRRDDAPAALTALQVEGWQLLREEWAADAAAQADRRAWEARRAGAQPAVVALAAEFLAGRADAAGLRDAFDRGTRAEWDALGLRGPAGAMFLNRLVKHARGLTDAAGTAALDAALRAALRPPADPAAAPAQLAAFGAWLRDHGLGAQPALATAFVTAWWHLQAPTRWPAYRPSMRRALEVVEGVFVPSGRAPADYPAFRAAVRALCAALDLHPWAFEHLCRWDAARDVVPADDAPPQPARVAPPTPRRRARRPGAASAPRPRAARVHEPPAPPPNTPPHPSPPFPSPQYPSPQYPSPPYPSPPYPSHLHVQWLLARLGLALGCRVWVAANDHARVWRGERLGDLSVGALPPLGLDPASQRLVELVDVVWLRGAGQVAAAFEVERTTSVHSGLLRMADLAALAPNLAVPLYVVAPEVRLDKVRRELRRPALRALGLHRRCGFFSAEALVDAAPDIARWASGPEAIDRLAERLGA